VTPTLSVDAVQVRATVVGPVALADRPVGTVGAWVSEGVKVKFLVVVEPAVMLTLPLVLLKPVLLTVAVYVPAGTLLMV
jgi:hypothetical protein